MMVAGGQQLTRKGSLDNHLGIYTVVRCKQKSRYRCGRGRPKVRISSWGSAWVVSSPWSVKHLGVNLQFELEPRPVAQTGPSRRCQLTPRVAKRFSRVTATDTTAPNIAANEPYQHDTTLGPCGAELSTLRIRGAREKSINFWANAGKISLKMQLGEGSI